MNAVNGSVFRGKEIATRINSWCITLVLLLIDHDFFNKIMCLAVVTLLMRRCQFKC